MCVHRCVCVYRWVCACACINVWEAVVPTDVTQTHTAMVLIKLLVKNYKRIFIELFLKSQFSFSFRTIYSVSCHFIMNTCTFMHLLNHMAAAQCTESYNHSDSNIRMEEKCDLRDFDHGMVAISGLFSRVNIIREWYERKENTDYHVKPWDGWATSAEAPHQVPLLTGNRGYWLVSKNWSNNFPKTVQLK